MSAVLAVSVVASACGGGGEEAKTDDTLDLVTTTTSPENLLKLPDPTSALASLAEFLKFEPRLLGVSVSQLNVGARIRNNDEEDKVDSYIASFDPTTGAVVWTGPKPAKLTSDDIAKLDAQEFARGDVRWEMIPDLAGDLVFALGEGASVNPGECVVVDPEGGACDIEPLRVPGAGVNRSVTQTSAGDYQPTVITISLTVEGTRGTGLLSAEADGTLREIKRT